MKKIVLSVLVLLLITSACSTKKKINTITQAPLKKALLWKITGKNITTPSYLFGTIHIIDAKDYFLPEGLLSAVDNSKKMVFEIDMNEITDMSKIMGIMSSAFMKDGQTLKDLLSDEDYSIVNKHFQKIGLPLMLVEKIKPMFLSAFSYGDLDPTGLKNGSVKSYEFELNDIATNAKIPVGGLETIEFQMGVFDSISYEDQAKMLVETIKQSDTGSNEFEKMVEVYKSQNINAMVTMIAEDENMSQHEDIFLNKRNKNWIPIMSEMMAKEPVFFAVGAGHLAGKNGVIRLLQKEGYTLSPILKK